MENKEIISTSYLKRGYLRFAWYTGLTFDSYTGEYHYILSQIPGDDPTYDYDTAVYKITVYTDSISGTFATIIAQKEGGRPEDKTSNFEFVNIKKSEPTTGSLTIEKNVVGLTDEEKENYAFDFIVEDEQGNCYTEEGEVKEDAVIKVKAEEPLTINDLPAGEYTVEEVTENIDIPGYRFDGVTYSPEDGKVTVEPGETATIQATNKFTAIGSLTIKKVVTIVGAGAIEHTFKFTVTDEMGNWYDKDGKAYDHKVEIEIGANEEITIDELPAGNYTIEEDENDTAVPNYQFIGVDYEDGNTVEVTKAEAKTVTVTNRYMQEIPPQIATGDLTVAKTVAGNAGEKTKAFTFTVELDDSSINGTYGDMTFVDGKASFTLKDGESKRAIGLPAGITYTVTEAEANQDGYVTTVTNESGTILADETIIVAFVNEKNMDPPKDPDETPEATDNTPKPLDDTTQNPDNGKNPDVVPRTGDENCIVLWTYLMGISGLAMVVLLRRKQKSER